MTEATYALGDRVTFTRSLHRTTRDPSHWPEQAGRRANAKVWTTERWLGDISPAEPRPGIVVGKRTLANGLHIWGSYEDPDTFRPIEHFTAYLIAYDLRRSPVYVLPEHITPTTQENTDDE